MQPNLLWHLLMCRMLWYLICIPRDSTAIRKVGSHRMSMMMRRRMRICIRLARRRLLVLPWLRVVMLYRSLLRDG